MIIVDNLKDYVPKAPCAVALGRFDGLHRGHKAVIESAKNGLKPIFSVLTFSYSQHDFEDLNLSEGIMTDCQKARAIESLGADVLFLLPFSHFRHLSPEAFIKDILANSLKAELVCCGYDFRFGKNAAGTPEDLERLCTRYGIEVKVVPAVCDDGSPISSTRIRRHIENGDINEASRLLGHRYCLDFTVEKGSGRGTAMGTPTINQSLPENFVLPKTGVYASCVKIEDRRFCGVTNIGVKPTVSEEGRVNAETFIKCFSGDLYGKRVRVELYDYLRSEKKFDSIDELRRQILCDSKAAVEITKKYLEG